MNRKILALAIPNIISNITVPLVGMVDMAIVGHLGVDSLIGAMAIGVAIFNFIYWNFAFLRMGTSGLVAQALRLPLRCCCSLPVTGWGTSLSG